MKKFSLKSLIKNMPDDIIIYVFAVLVLIVVTIGAWHVVETNPYTDVSYLHKMHPEKVYERAILSTLALIISIVVLCRQLFIHLFIQKPIYAIVLKKTKTNMSENNKPRYKYSVLLKIIDKDNNISQLELNFNSSWYESCKQGDFVKIKHNKKGTRIFEIINDEDIPTEIKNKLEVSE